MLVSEDTYELVAHGFVTESLGLLEVQGKAEPVSIYRVVEPKARFEKPRGIAGLDSPLVGRAAEYAALQGAIERLHTGEGGIVTIVGEAGIGKSRLVSEVRKQVDSSALQWVEGRCLSYGSSITFLLWLEALRELIGASVEAKPQEIREQLKERVKVLCPQRYDEIYPYLGRMLSLSLEEKVESKLDALDGWELREATFQAMEKVIAGAAQERSMVIVCEDLHWADPLALLEHLLPLIEGVPLLLITVFRTRKDHGSWSLRETAAIDHAERHTDLRFQPLSAADCDRLVGNLIGREDLPGELVWRILGQAEGNPFYVEEVIRSLASDPWGGKVSHSGYAARCADGTY